MPGCAVLSWKRGGKIDNSINRYSLEEIKGKFKENDWQLDEDEQEKLWETIGQLKKEHVDILKNEIHLIVLSQQKSKKYPQKSRKGIYLNMRDQELLKIKKGIIILSPFFSEMITKRTLEITELIRCSMNWLTICTIIKARFVTAGISKEMKEKQLVRPLVGLKNLGFDLNRGLNEHCELNYHNKLKVLHRRLRNRGWRDVI